MSTKIYARALKRSKKRVRIRKKISGATERPRLAVFRSAKNIYVQIIDDVQRRSLCGVSTVTPSLQKDVAKAKSKLEAAKLVGAAIAQAAKELKIESVVFDRGGYLYHGRVKAVADGAREGGLKF